MRPYGISLGFLPLILLTCVTNTKQLSEENCVGLLRTSVVEGISPGTVIFKFFRRPDVVYSFTNDYYSSSARAIFRISREGAVSNKITLDREDTRGNRFTLTVIRKEMGLHDKAVTTTACSLRIIIQDINDNSPTFAKDLYIGTIEENASVGTMVRGLEGLYAVDDDSGDNSVLNYNILARNGADNYFEAVTENIGRLTFLAIKTRKVLDREDISFYVLTVEATDGGKMKRTTTTQIRINVLDVNDCSPQFKPSEYSVSVLSSTPITTSVLKVHAEDDDSGANGELYYFLKTTTQSFFTVNPHTGVIRVAMGLEYAGPLLWFDVTAQDRASSPRQTTTVVKINIIKDTQQMSNINPLLDTRFTKRSYLVRALEDMPVNSHLLHANVNPLTGSTPEFRILSDKPVPFRVDANSSVLYLARSLDYEMTRVYEFKLQARTRQSRGHLDEAMIRVEVYDVDENRYAPVFKHANLVTTFRRRTSRNVRVKKLKANDKDENANGLVKYYIRGGNGVRMLSIDENLGEVYFNPSTNLEQVDALHVLVEARDCARQWKSAKQFLVVNIVGPRDCSPVFARSVYNVSLRENQQDETFVVVANAQDCAKREVVYSITAGNVKGRFTIENHTGIIRARQNLDREEQDEYMLEITAQSYMKSKAQVFIQIEDINDNKPVFTSNNYQVHITENRGKVENLLCLIAIDKDNGENGTVSYYIAKGNDKNLFKINHNTGTLSSESLNYEDQKEHTLVIRATDHGQPPRFSDTIVKVIVTDINDPPKFMTNNVEVSILEEKPIGSTVAFLPVHDEDSGGNGEFFCGYENINKEEFGKFEVKTTKRGCEVQNIKILDWFHKNIYSLKIRVTDKAATRIRKSTSIRVTIKIEDINNHAPEFIQNSYWISIPDDTPLSTVTILQVKATDKDSGLNAAISYTFNQTESLFDIDSKDGSITLNRKPYVGKHKIVVLAKDKGKPERRQYVVCFVSVYPRRINFPPKFIGPNQKLPENTRVSTLVTRTRLRGRRNRNVKFTIVGGNIGGTFEIRKNGDVFLARSLDYERVQEYKLIVRVVYTYQRRVFAIEVPLKLKVLDVNDNKPSFALTNHPLVIDVNKRLARSVFIAHVSAFDADSEENGKVTYTIKRRLDPVYFSIHPKFGIIRATRSLSSRDAPYTFTIIATDRGTPRKQTEYDVQVRIHRNSEPVSFQPGKREGSVNEGPLGIHTTTATLSVNHQGENDVIYSIINGNTENSFCVDVTGAVYSIREMDRETRAKYTLNILANDGESSAVVGLNISVNDINDNSPEFSLDPIRVFTKENARAQKIGMVKVTDRDWKDNGRLYYEMVSTSSTKNANMFRIGKNDGALTILKILDREESPEHELTVAAIDQGSPSRRTFARVIITVVDENDHTPRFLSRSFTANVPYNAPLGYPVLQTLATDQDSGNNGDIRYKIHSKTTMFIIDESTGWISVASTLQLGTVSFLVSAADKGMPPRNATARVTLTVEAGAGPPRFVHVLPRGYHVSVSEDQSIGEVVLTVTAASRDLVTYAIDDVNIKDFVIDEISGKITIAQPLDFESRRSYEFTVSAADRNDRVSNAYVTISVLNVNDNKPRIWNKNSNNVIVCRVLRHAALGSLVTRIQVSDNDTNDQLYFTLGTNQTYFSIDSLGYIKTKGVLRDIGYDVYFGVTVTDNGVPPLQDTAIVRVVLMNYDVTQSSLHQLVSESMPVGSTIILSPKMYRANRRSRFSIAYPDDPPFTIQPMRGNLVLRKPLDYEVQRKYSLTVRIGERSKPKDNVDVDVTIIIKDENDNVPEFDTTGDSPDYASVHINARQGTLIYQFKASDNDSGSNGEVEYRMGTKYQGLFEVGQKTGELKTTGVTLERRTYNVSVVAYDKGTPSLSTRTFIMVNAEFMKPRFSQKEYEFDLYENVTVGEYVGVIKAKSFGVLLTYKIMGRDSRFSIHPNTGVLTLLRPVDHEKSEQRVLRLWVVAATTQETSRTRVTIHVKDVNDCTPKFYKPRYVDTVPESAPISTTVLTVHAMDEDAGINAELRYSLDNDDFIIDPYTGVVITAAVLDFEKKPLYKMNVVAHDRGTPTLMGMAQLIVNVTNVNDNKPVFTSQVYTCSLWENARRGSLVTTVKAIDDDNDLITYDITSGDDVGAFVINTATGVIKVSNDPSVSLTGSSYHLNVAASDGTHKVQAMVKVTIKDINDHAPVFSECDRYSPSVPEGSPIGTSVVRVHATDEDLGSNGEVEYAIVHPNTLFQVDRKTGLIQSAVVFDRQNQRSYSIRIKATDGESNMRADERRESSCLFSVTITDINDNKPIFSMRHYETSIKEDVQVGHDVLQVQADDNDEGLNAEVRYAFKPSTPFFDINSRTGVITTQANLMNKNQVYTLRVTATDNGVPRLQSEADVTINVIDSENNPPTFQQNFYEMTVPENMRKNSEVITIVATPPKVYYRIIPGNVPATNNPTKFVIDATRGVVQVQGELDRESTPNYTLTIRAENDANPPLSSWTILRILVTDINDCSPEFTVGEYEGGVPEDSVAGTSVLTVAARDRDNDPYNRIEYTISEENQYFSIEKSTGVIRSKMVFDRENVSRYKFVVKATDMENPGLWNDVIVNVLVTDVNDLPPEFVEHNYKATIYENAENGTKVVTVSANDNDLGLNAKIRYYIETGNDHDKFRIDPDTGRVEVNGQIDYEEETEYELTVSAWDGIHKDTATVMITVENENDNSPMFLGKDGVKVAEVPENSPPGTIVTSLTATDRDFDSRKFTKMVKYGLSDKVDGIFRVNPNTGVIRTEIGLDRETKDTYIFEAYAHDGYGKSGSIEVIVTVRDVNDHKPEFLDISHVGVVYENEPPGTLAKEVKAEDKDDITQGGNAIIKYHLQSDPYSAFTINENTGKITTRKVFDRENQSSYILVVNATDGGKPPLSNTTRIVVHVLDRNDHAPKFNMSVFETRIAENKSIGSVVLKLRAKDQDTGRNAKLKFKFKNNADSNFKVHSNTGEVVVFSRLDYEKKTSYEFEVKVEDLGIPSKSDTAKVIIHIDDCNDNSPYFIRDYVDTLPEGTYDNQRLLKLEAYDDDSTAINKDLRYSISDGDPTGIFNIDSSTGEFFVVSDLDYEATQRHVVKVRATNTAPPYLYGETEVKISLTDMNDNAPELTNCSMNRGVYENLPGGYREIGKLQATDRDTHPNGEPFTFGIIGDSEIFQVDWKTGMLTTNTTFDRELQSSYILEVWVRDSGVPPLTNNTQVNINVLDRNDNQHRKGHLELTVNLMARQTISPTTLVGRVHVNDEDIDDLRYYDMLSGDANTFHIDKHSGGIFLRQRPLPGQYTFKVKVSDRNSTFGAVICTVKMDVNEISTEAFTKSVSLRFHDMNQEQFINLVYKYKRVIAHAVNTRPENVDIFSLQNAGGGVHAVDVRFAAHGSPYYEPERLIALLNANRHLFGEQLVIIGYDACASEPCKDGGCRSKVVMTGEVEAIDDGSGQAFGSVATKTEIKCGKCENLFTSKTMCDPNSCLNRSCTQPPNAFVPLFSEEQSSLSCGLSTRSFTRGDWIWLRSLKSCRDIKVSLEFSTLKENGLLLYNGPDGEPARGDNYDFIVIELVQGKIHVGLSFGLRIVSKMVIDKSRKLNDGKWHLVEIHRNDTLVLVTIDQCRSASVKRLENEDKEDRSSCETRWIVKKTQFNVVDVNEPLQIGGVSSQPPIYTDIRTTTYDGCIRNVKENGEMLDLKEVLNVKGSREGCPKIDRHCEPKSPCFGSATCLPTRKGFSCICPPGYEGPLCDVESVGQTFTPPGFIKYQLSTNFLRTYNAKFTKIEMMVRTRDRNGGILMVIYDHNGVQRLIIRFVKGRTLLTLSATVKLGDDEYVVQLVNALPQDGQWHHVIFTRNRNELHLGTDSSRSSRKVSGKSDGKFIVLKLSKSSEIFVGGVGNEGYPKDNLDGCIKDIRINGHILPMNRSNQFATRTKLQGVAKGCKSMACENAKCSSRQFCHDMWRKHKCLYRPCNSNPCHNGAKCLDEVVGGIPLFHCICSEGFNGTQCSLGANVIMLTGDGEVINVKLIIGLSSFVFILALATLLIICYHRYQAKGKATFDGTLKKIDVKNAKHNKKSLVVVDGQNSSAKTQTTTAIPNMYSTKPLIHTCDQVQRPEIPFRTDSLQPNGDAHPMEIPVWDIPPMIDVVLSPDSNSSQIEEDYIEEEQEIDDHPCDYIKKTEDELSPDDESNSEDERSPEGELNWDLESHGSASPKSPNSPTQPSTPTPGFKVPTVTWNDIEEFGRKFYTKARDFLAKDDESRSNSGISTASNSSSVVTVVENQHEKI